MSGSSNEMHPGLNRFQQAIYDYVPETVQKWMNGRTTASELQDHQNSPTSVEATFREWDAFDRQNPRATLDERQTFHNASIDRAFQDWNQERTTSSFETVYLPENAVDRSAEYLSPLSNSDEATKATQSWNTDMGQTYMAEVAEREYRENPALSPNLEFMEEAKDWVQVRDPDLGTPQPHMTYPTEGGYLDNPDFWRDLQRSEQKVEEAQIDVGIVNPGSVISITEHPNYPTISQEQRDAARTASVDTPNQDHGVLQFRQMERDQIQDGGLEK